MIEGRTEWMDLSGVELRRRLTQRGVDEDLAYHLAAHREWEKEAAAIEQILNGKPL